MKTMILGKDSSLEETIANMTSKINALGIDIEIASWLNPLPHVWSVHIRDRDCPMSFTNGKGASKDAALCSALGEYLERISCNYLHANWYLGEEVANGDFVHYQNEKWFPITGKKFPKGFMDETLMSIYNPNNELTPAHLVDNNSGNTGRGICALPFERQSDKESIFIPMNIVGNLFVSNGMSAGNNKFETRVQCLSEIFERAVKNQIILEELCLPTIPNSVLEKYPKILEGIKKLEAEGFPVLVKDASFGGKFPVVNVTLMNPKNGGVYASFGAHPKFEVALERTLTELLQGRTLETLDVCQRPTFNQNAVCNHDNIEDHFVDSTGIISWKFFGEKADFEFCEWDFSGSTEEEYNYLMSILEQMEKEVYIADYTHLGVSACRILVPGYSEIYSIDDLMWDNNNRAIEYRSDILNIHTLSDKKLTKLLEKLEENAIDDFTTISELISVAFDFKTAWGELTVGELKSMIYLALGNYEEAKNLVETFINFNEASFERKKYFQALDTILDIKISEEELNVNNYIPNMEKLFGKEIVANAMDTVEGKIKFFGLTKTNMNLEGIIKHQKLIESYHKLQKAKRGNYGN